MSALCERPTKVILNIRYACSGFMSKSHEIPSILFGSGARAIVVQVGWRIFRTCGRSALSGFLRRARYQVGASTRCLSPRSDLGCRPLQYSRCLFYHPDGIVPPLAALFRWPLLRAAVAPTQFTRGLVPTPGPGVY